MGMTEIGSSAKTVVHDDMRVTMRDGVTLSARVWMPATAANNPCPAILEMLPYRKRDGTDARDATTHAQFAKHGYACLRVDLRGCGESGGLFDDEYSEQELNDIEDAIAWIADQPWCSGDVGIMGISWGGFNGLQAAARRPAALKAVISLCSSVDRFADDIHYKGGCQLIENIGWAATATSWCSMPPDPALVGDRWREIWLQRLENTPFLASHWLRHASRDAYWKHGSVCEDFSRIEAPVLVIGGWHDGYRNTALKLLEGGTSGPVKAIMGPWNHKYPHIAAPKPQMDFVAEAVRWWDHWLKGVPNGVDDDPAYRVYVMDGIAPQTSYDHRPGRWVALPDWPSSRSVMQRFTLGNGTLGAKDMDAPRSISSDPRCGRGFGEFFPFGFGPGELPDDQRGDDALSACFDSDPLTDDTAVVGAPRLRLGVSADRPFAQLAVRLCDVAPDGSSTLVSLGLLNLQFRDGFEEARPLTPGQAYEITVDLDQAGYVIPKGHRIRIAVSPSYWPFIWPERGATVLTLSAGELSLPILSARGNETWTCPAPAYGSPDVVRTVHPGTEDKSWTVEEGQQILRIHGDHGTVEHLEHGLHTASEVHETFTIDLNNIANASVEILWKRSVARDGFVASSRVLTKMLGDHKAYHVTVDVQANDGDDRIFKRRFQDTIPRDLADTNTRTETKGSIL